MAQEQAAAFTLSILIKGEDMTQYTYNQTIEYIDGTRDLNFEAAQKWAQENGTTFKEDVTARVNVGGALKRYFVIGSEPEPNVPTTEEVQAAVRAERDRMINAFEWRISRNNDERELGLTETDNRELLLEYRQYLRNYPETENWYEHNPLTFEEWKELPGNSGELEQIVDGGD